MSNQSFFVDLTVPINVGQPIKIRILKIPDILLPLKNQELSQLWTKLNDI